MNPAIAAVISGVIALVAGLLSGYLYRKNVMENKIGHTEAYVQNLLNDATRKAEDKKKEAVLEAKEEIIRLKSCLLYTSRGGDFGSPPRVLRALTKYRKNEA